MDKMHTGGGKMGGSKGGGVPGSAGLGGNKSGNTGKPIDTQGVKSSSGRTRLPNDTKF